nr:glycosyltransferase [Vibrio owensii]
MTLTYNNWRLLERAINSVDSQVVDERYEVEYIIVDDGTKDFNIKDVESILLTTSLNYKIVVNESNLGTVASFNKAIKFSQGDIIIPLAADDEFYNDNVVNEISNSFEDNNVDILTTFRVPIVNGEEGPSLPDARKFDYLTVIVMLSC